MGLPGDNPPRRLSVPRDPCTVRTEPLSHLLTSFVRDWNVDRTPTAGRFTRGGRETVSPVSAVAWLAAETGYRRKTIQNIVSGRTQRTPLSLADALVTAIGHPEAFHDGTLVVEPQSSTVAARAACCGGSMTMRF